MNIQAKSYSYWAGNNPPNKRFYSSNKLTTKEFGYREDSINHGKFVEVNLTEINLGLEKSWPFILDEAFRLFAHNEQAELHLRFTQNETLTIFQLANYVRKRPGLNFSLLHQARDGSGDYHISFKVFRNLQKPTLEDLEFGIITDGVKIKELEELIKSINEITGIQQTNFRISICGPESSKEQISKISQKVNYVIAPPEFELQGWITRKKNLLLDYSLCENIVICHDRYRFPKDFLVQLISYGPDFSVFVPRQVDILGSRFPDWVTLSSRWALTAPALLEYNEYHPHNYANGGILIGKSQILKQVRWNEYLLWDQGEDIELSRELEQQGITIRFADSVEVCSITARKGYENAFLSLPSNADGYPTTVVIPPGFTPYVATIKESKIILSNESPKSLSDKGIVVQSSDWRFNLSGLSLTKAAGRIDFSLEEKQSIHEVEIVFGIGFGEKQKANELLIIDTLTGSSTDNGIKKRVRGNYQYKLRVKPQNNKIFVKFISQQSLSIFDLSIKILKK